PSNSFASLSGRLFMRVLIPGVLALSVAVPAGLRAADDDPKAILEKAIKAHGGESHLAKHQAGSSKNKGKITLAGVGEVEFTQETSFMLPDKLKEAMELTVAGQKINVVTLVNGDKISIDANGTDVPITDPIKEALKDGKYVMKVARLIAPLKEKG